MIRRPPRSTPLYSSAASDVYKRQLGLITPRQLRVQYEKHDLLQLWPKLLTHPADGVTLFRSVGTEEIFRSVDWSQFAGMATWWNYVQDRYAGILGKYKRDEVRGHG